MANIYIGLTPRQRDAVHKVLALVLNDPTWPHDPGDADALSGALTALHKTRDGAAGARR